MVCHAEAEGHPLVFAQALFGQPPALQGDKAAWKIVDAHPEWIRTVPMDRPAPGTSTPGRSTKPSCVMAVRTKS